jgi:hypothetical protein
MFARHMILQLKPNVANELPVTFEKEILPLLHRQKGFLDELLLVTPEKREAVAISLWETKEYAEIYTREVYPQTRDDRGQVYRGRPDSEEVRGGILHVSQGGLRGEGLIAKFPCEEGAKLAPSFLLGRREIRGSFSLVPAVLQNFTGAEGFAHQR